MSSRFVLEIQKSPVAPSGHQGRIATLRAS